MRWSFAIVAAAIIALGCSGSATMSHDALERELRQLHSLDAEAGLTDELINVRHVTRKFARGHAHYLRHAAHEHVVQLAPARPEPGDEAALARAQADAVRLEQRFVALMVRLQ